MGSKEPVNVFEHHSLLGPGPVKLTPSWEEKNLPSDELNFKHMTLDEDYTGKPPADRWNLVYLIFLLHGVGTLMPWNMFITAKHYFTKYKLNTTATDQLASDYSRNFLPYLALASQIPNVVFSWLNLFVPIGGDLTTRVVVAIVTEVVIFIETIILAMIDSSSWPGIFFWVTMASVVVLNMANGIYQNSVYGMAAKLPMKYSNAVVLGSNISGTLTAIINIISIAAAPNIRTAAVYYFITALFVLLACFDTFFALPLLKFYRYYEKQSEKRLNGRRNRIPYWYIFRKAFPQLFNVWMVFFVTLSIYPAILSDISRVDRSFFIPETYYTEFTCYFCFNVTAMIGNLFPFFIRFPGPRWLCLPVFLRILMIPYFVFCNYLPPKRQRILPILFYNDWAYIGMTLVLGWTSGYFSSLAMMYAPRSVEPQYAGTAGMMGAASLILGIFCGINFALFLPWFVENVTFFIG